MAAWFSNLSRNYWRSLILWALATDQQPATYDPAAMDKVIRGQ